jgi:hypothetical protein
VGLLGEVVDREKAVAAAAADRQLLDDPPGAVNLPDLELGVVLRERGLESEARRRALSHRVHAGQPVVVHVVVRVRRAAGEITDEVEDPLALGRDDLRHVDLAHGAGSYMQDGAPNRRG